MGIPVMSVRVGRVLRAEVRQIGGVFEAALRDDGQALVGEWRQGGATLPLTLEGATVPRRTSPTRPQEPKPSYPYTVEQVAYQNAKAGITLAGTLTIPKGLVAPAPAVLLLSGSGPQDPSDATQTLLVPPILALLKPLAPGPQLRERSQQWTRAAC